MSSIMLYVGTLLIGFELVGNLSHLFALLLHSLGRIATSLGSQKKKQTSQDRRAFLDALKNIPRQVLLSLLLIVVTAITIVMFVVWLVGQFLVYVNARLNTAYADALDPRKTDYISIGRVFVTAMGKDKPAINNLEIWEKIKQRGFPFVGLIGIIILSAGFALQLLGR
jgi:hypothetical protein